MSNYYIINSGSPMDKKNVLVIIHNAGFFSCSSIALQDIMIYYNQKHLSNDTHSYLPDNIDRHQQYAWYKIEPRQDLIPFFFKERPDILIGPKHLIPWPLTPVRITEINDIEPQFSDYKQLDFDSMKPFIDKFFMPSDYVWETIEHLKEKYEIEPENTCAVFYRGNDKNRETSIAPYSEFINKAKEIQDADPDIRFMVQPDETEFLEAFLSEFPDSIFFEETPHIRKKDTCTFLELPIDQRSEQARNFFAAVMIMSECRRLITHSGNGGLWSVIYRGNAENVCQWINDKWI